MNFEFAEEVPNTVESLRALEPQAPKPLKATMLQAADELQRLREACHESALALELASTLKAGVMDSESRHYEVAKQVTMTLVQIAAKLRAVSE
jgi:uncharacterized alpha-E superfamily protein